MNPQAAIVRIANRHRIARWEDADVKHLPEAREAAVHYAEEYRGPSTMIRFYKGRQRLSDQALRGILNHAMKGERP